MLDCFCNCRGEISPKVWSLFKDIEKYNGSFEIEHVEEILNSALSGDIDLTRDFNLAGYEHAILHREYKNKCSKASKIKFISFADSPTELEGDLRSGGLTIDEASYMSQNFAEVKSDFDVFFDNEELSSAVASIKQLNPEFIAEFDVDLIMLLKKATCGVPQAISKLKEICSNFAVVAEQIKILLTSGVSVEECFG